MTYLSLRNFQMLASLPWAACARVQPVLLPRSHSHQIYRKCLLTMSVGRYSTNLGAVTEFETEESQKRRYNQTITLPDGRKLGYAEAGSPTGYPLLIFHGFPGSRLEARGLEEIGRRHNIRIIATDRPGYGLSTYHPTFRITDWPADVQYLARQLGLKRFAVVGGSGGGPFALACAHAIPSEMLTSVGLFASAGPWEAGTRAVPKSARIGSWAATNCPYFATGLLDLVTNLAKRFVYTDTGKKLMDNALSKAIKTVGKELPEHEQQKAVAERRERAIRIFLEPFAQGSKGFVREAYLLAHPYGFRLEDVKPMVYIWHGTKDSNSPIHMVRYMAKRLPNCKLREFEGETHFTIMKCLEEIVTTLVPPDISISQTNKAGEKV